ncbi:hypothetical protein DQ04_05411030 [Trypanosoma grayi]|uniref:hypothetical protein n=1 Tax=Trypanosoma grayi TaxID=71804 RepID=UPI0004F4509F|nr:hypothetical protein DQ04_05411030 [Trypanosoma grayi]KEG09327.1 hypothetical protein DQ04_05411030 [Trypanosoma grayi]
MPVPPVSFTRSKWLAFFAELTAKITHHNVLVVLEGCEVLKRILVSRVSVAAFLEEGDLLMHLVDTIAGDMLTNERRDNGPPLAMAEKLLFTQLETLSLVIDMMMALHADKDPYYCLLVLARAGAMLMTLVGLLQRQHPRFFGIIATIVQVLLGLPLGRDVRGLHVDKSRSVALACHIQKLETAVAQQGPILQETVEVLQALSLSTDGAMQYCSQFLLNLATRRLKRIRKTHMHDASTTDGDWSVKNVGLNQSEHPLAETTMEEPIQSQNSARVAPSNDTRMSIDTTEGSEVENSGDCSDINIPEKEYEDCFERLTTCRSHDEFFVMMNRLWCLTVAAGDEVQRRFTSLNFDRAFRRFLLTMPSNQQDQMVFTSVLLWLSHMMSGYYLRSDTRDSILSVAGSALIQIVPKCQRSRELLAQREEPGLSSIQTSTNVANSASVSRAESFMSPECVAGERSSGLVERPSISFVVLSFLLIAERACGPQQMEQWIREGGLFAMLEALIRNVEYTKSALIDTPTTMDGALSDEVYLACAMTSTRTEHVTLAALACKLLTSVVWNHYAALNKLLAPETSVMLQMVIPLLLKISIHNPTLTSSIENVSGSALHHSPSCQRSSRYTSLGECSLVALDACFWLMEIAQLDVVHLQSVIPSLPALSRATRNSIHPPLRASAYRCLARLCGTPAELVTVIREMPSVVNAAVTSVLEYSPTAPQWEAAAAAEWLAHVIRIAANDVKVERSFNFTRTALPIKLLELASSNGITYATAALLSLTASLFEQQKHFADYHHETSNSVILPYGKRSLECWFRLIRVTTQANEKLAQVCDKAIPTATTTKDALSRSLSSIEGISVQSSFACSLARGLLFLLISHPEHRDHFSNDIMYGLFASAFALPSLDAIFDVLAVRFGVRVEQHAALERSYESMLQWMMQLCSVWFGAVGNTAKGFPALPPLVFGHLCSIMRNNRISQRTRSHVCALISNLVLVPSDELSEALAESSGDLFAASLTLTSVSCVSGMQCRLVAHFAAANEKAHEVGWFAARVLELGEHVQELKGGGGTLGTQDMESLLVSLSFVCSVLTFPDCRAVPREVLHPLSASLRSVLGYETTRRMAFRAAAALASSSEGRRCLLHEVSTAGEPLTRTCFGRILGLTLGVAQGSENQQLQRENNNAMKRTPIGEREASKAVVTTLGFDICATACGKGGEAFTHGVMKLRGVEHMESLFLRFERQRTPVPLGLFRLLAALSFQAEAQLAIIRQVELMTMVIEAAANASSAGTLALLTLRNLCFNSTLKTQLCQDNRILLTFKAALMAQPTLQPLLHDSNSPESKESMKAMLSLQGEVEVKKASLQSFAEQAASRYYKKTEGGNSTCSFDSAEIFRRQELAVTAFWSLMYDNQRGKSYVRGVLSQAPAVNMSKLTMPYIQVAVSTPELQKYPEKMSEAIDNIKLLGKGAL